MKYFTVLTLAVLAYIAVGTDAQNHSTQWGVIGPYDKLLYRELVNCKSKGYFKSVKDVIFPPKGIVPQHTITGIKALDQLHNGQGGYATIKNGGVGYNQVTVHVKSQRKSDCHYIIEIYGR